MAPELHLLNEEQIYLAKVYFRSEDLWRQITKVAQ